MPAFVLCDPALLMPPPSDELGAARFWARLVEWSSDHRVRLGPASHALVVSTLGRFGYPQRDAQKYPPGLAQLAHRTLAIMLGQALAAEIKGPSPRLTPRYQANDEGEAAISADIAALHDSPLIGLATAREHWGAESDTIKLDPPPPASVYLLLEPEERLAVEIDQGVKLFLEKRRLTIVGGVPNEQVVEGLNRRFGPKEIRWLGAEPGSRLNVDPLAGLQARTDVVYCVTSHIGHDGSTRAKQCCGKRGVELRKVSKASDIADDLCRRHGQTN